MSIIPFPTADKPRYKSCQTCRHLVNPKRDAYYWKCGISGFPTAVESNDRIGGDCGSEKMLWELRPPRKPGFFSRLGDAIIERIRGKARR